MVEDAKEPVGSMGDDTPLAVLSDRYRGLHHFFRQNFSQVTNPPIDSLRETRVMTLKTRFGNLGNVLDEDQSQCDLLQLESPVLSTAEFQAMRDLHGRARSAWSIAPSRWPTAKPACARRWNASAARPRTPCAAAAPM